MKYRNLILLIVSVVFIAGLSFASTFISDTGIDLDQGVLINPSTIILDNEPLVFRDEFDNRVVAVFNLLTNNTLPMALVNDPVQVTNRQTVFFGDVSNIDDIDAFSRFKETNINNGTSASAGFTAENDAGINITFGIGSSNFEVGGQKLPSTPAIQSFAPAPFRFVNRLREGFVWRANINNDPSSGATVRDIMNLSDSGNLNIVANYTGESIQFRPNLRETCNSTIQGTIIYDLNGTSGDFYGCKMQNINTFIWTKF